MSPTNRHLRIPAKNILTPAEDDFNIDAVTAENINITARKEMQTVGSPRASSLYKECVRLNVIGTKLGRKKTSWVSVQSKVTFGLGNALHSYIQNSPEVFGDKRVGYWKCIACNTILYFGQPPKGKCTNCGAHKSALIYEEFILKVDSPVMVSGHPDLFLDHPDGLIRVLEIKTIKKDSFLELRYPLVEHVWQILTYMRLCNRCKNPTPRKVNEHIGYVLYVCKEHTSNKILPYKMFPVVYDEATFKLIVNRLVSYKDGILNYPNKLPECHSDCMSKDKTKFNDWGYRHKACPVATECKRFFRGK